MAWLIATTCLLCTGFSISPTPILPQLSVMPPPCRNNRSSSASPFVMEQACKMVSRPAFHLGKDQDADQQRHDHRRKRRLGQPGGAGGSGLANTGTIATLTNTGTISNGAAGADAILSEGADASIGPPTNSGQIVGAVELLGGSGDTLDSFGRISGNVALSGGDLLMNQGQVHWRRDARRLGHADRHGRHPGRRGPRRVGHVRCQWGRCHRGDHGFERRSPRVQRQFRP